MTTCQMCGARVEGLSGREAEVIGLLAQGLSRSHVAERLGITVRTVRLHVERAQNRNGARSFTHTVVMAIRRGWVPWEASR